MSLHVAIAAHGVHIDETPGGALMCIPESKHAPLDTKLKAMQVPRKRAYVDMPPKDGYCVLVDRVRPTLTGEWIWLHRSLLS